MKRWMIAFAAVGLLALPGAAAAQQEGSRGWWGGWGNHSTECPQPKRTAEKITEDQARDLAQEYGNKNPPGFKVDRPAGYGGGYNTTCYQITSAGAYQILHFVEYSIDLATPAGDRRNVRVDQFGNVVPFGGPFGVAGAQGLAGQMGAQALSGGVGAQGKAGAMHAALDRDQLIALEHKRRRSKAEPDNQDDQQWALFKNFLFDTDKSDIRSNEMSKVSEIADYMRQNSSAKVGIDGHADPRGTDQYNQALSERRVNAIRDALAKAGVQGNRIQTGAFGEQRLQCNQSTEACWQSDRRVEVLIDTDTANTGR